MQLFEIKEQKFHHCPGTKGQWDELKILPRDGKDVLKQENDVVKQEIWSFFENF